MPPIPRSLGEATPASAPSFPRDKFESHSHASSQWFIFQVTWGFKKCVSFIIRNGSRVIVMEVEKQTPFLNPQVA